MVALFYLQFSSWGWRVCRSKRLPSKNYSKIKLWGLGHLSQRSTSTPTAEKTTAGAPMPRAFSCSTDTAILLNLLHALTYQKLPLEVRIKKRMKNTKGFCRASLQALALTLSTKLKR